MATVKKGVRIAVALYDSCTEIFEELGITTSMGISIFLKHVIRENGMRFAQTSHLFTGRRKSVNRSFNIDNNVYEQAKAILESQGYTLSQAVNLYFETVSKTKGIPFPLQLKE